MIRTDTVSELSEASTRTSRLLTDCLVNAYSYLNEDGSTLNPKHYTLNPKPRISDHRCPAALKI